MIYAPAMVTSALPPARRTIDQVLAEARARLDRLTPQQALRAVASRGTPPPGPPRPTGRLGAPGAPPAAEPPGPVQLSLL